MIDLRPVPVNVREATANHMNALYEGGRIDRKTWLVRQEIGDKAARALGDEIPDTALALGHVHAWIRQYLDAKPA